MKPDIYSLAKAGLSKEEINEISECEDKERQIRMLRSCIEEGKAWISKQSCFQIKI